MGSHNSTQKLLDNNAEFAEQYRKAGEECLRRKSYNHAITHFQKALDIGAVFLKNQKFILISIYKNIAACYHGLRNYEQASHFYKKASKLAKTNKRKYCHLQLEIYKNVTQLHEQQGQLKDAHKTCKKRVKFAKKYLGRKRLGFEEALLDLGILCRKMERSKEALKYFKALIKSIEKGQGDSHPLAPKCYNYLGLMSKSSGKTQLAVAYYNKALISGKSAYKNNRIDLAKIYYNLALIQKDQQEFELAWQNLKECIKIEAANLSSSKSNIQETVKMMVFLAKVCPIIRSEVLMGISFLEGFTENENSKSTDVHSMHLHLKNVIDIPKIKALLAFNCTFAEEQKRDDDDLSCSFLDEENDNENESLPLIKKGASNSSVQTASMQTQASFGMVESTNLSQIVINPLL